MLTAQHTVNMGRLMALHTDMEAHPAGCSVSKQWVYSSRANQFLQQIILKYSFSMGFIRILFKSEFDYRQLNIHQFLTSPIFTLNIKLWQIQHFKMFCSFTYFLSNHVVFLILPINCYINVFFLCRYILLYKQRSHDCKYEQLGKHYCRPRVGAEQSIPTGGNSC